MFKTVYDYINERDRLERELSHLTTLYKAARRREKQKEAKIRQLQKQSKV